VKNNTICVENLKILTKTSHTTHKFTTQVHQVLGRLRLRPFLEPCFWNKKDFFKRFIIGCGSVSAQQSLGCVCVCVCARVCVHAHDTWSSRPSECLLELPRGLHLLDNVQTSKQLSVGVELWVRRPVRVLLETCPDLFVTWRSEVVTW
jgi:hypothetical protein